MFRRKKPTEEAPRPVEPSFTDWSDLESIRKEWPSEDFDSAADLKSGLSGKQLYDQEGAEYGRMMRAGELMCRALRHHLYGDGILAGADLPETVHSVLFASTSRPPDGVTLTPQARRQIRLALTVMKKHSWQPTDMGGNGLLDSLFSPQLGAWLLFSTALATAGVPMGDLNEFFTRNPINIPAAAPAPTGTKDPLPSAEDQSLLDRTHALLADADNGDSASKARVQGIAAQMHGDNETALQRYEEAAELGDVDAMYDAGCLSSELGRHAVAIFWFEAAARAGHAVAAYNRAASAVRDGDNGTAHEWFQKAAELGDASGYASLTQMADEAGDAEAELHWARLGAENGHPFCMGRYGQLIIQANPNDPGAFRQALPLLERASEMGEVSAMLLAGIASNYMGRPSEARQWLQKAHQAGDPRAAELINKYGL